MKITVSPFRGTAWSCLFITLATLTACTNTVKYGEETRAETLRTEIGTADLLISGQRMLNKMLSNSSVNQLTRNRRPNLAYLALVDQTDENLNLSPFNTSIIQQLEGTGRFVLADQNKVLSVHQQSLDQLDFRAVTTATAGQFTEQVGSDVLLFGTITNLIRSKSNSKEVYYRITLSLWDNQQKKIIWQDEAEHLKTRKKIVFGL